MRLEYAVAGDVLERILSAYGFHMQKQLSDRLEIAKSNVASWLARGQVQGNVIVQCSLDTGADVNWLVTGELKKANFRRDISTLSGKALYDEVMANGGKPVLRRILDAYGFTLQKQLCELLSISSGTVSSWVRRNYFPGDVVLSCALDTGVSLNWLATGKGSIQVESKNESPEFTIGKKILKDGNLIDSDNWLSDLSFLPKKPTKPIFINGANGAWIIDADITSLSNGRWLLGVNGKFDIYDVALLPTNKIKVINEIANFSCDVNELDVKGKVVVSLFIN